MPEPSDMIRSVLFEERALDQAAAILAQDPDGLRTVLAAVDALAQEPYPVGSFAFGNTGLYRLRVGRYRVLYLVTHDLVTVNHLARIP